MQSAENDLHVRVFLSTATQARNSRTILHSLQSQPFIGLHPLIAATISYLKGVANIIDRALLICRRQSSPWFFVPVYNYYLFRFSVVKDGSEFLIIARPTAVDKLTLPYHYLGLHSFIKSTCTL